MAQFRKKNSALLALPSNVKKQQQNKPPLQILTTA